MFETVVLASAALCLTLYQLWGFRALPEERWQILASVPAVKSGPLEWRGVNLTWYGLLTANAYLAAVALFLVLMGALDVPVTGALPLVVLLLACCVPASRLVARVVEKKAHTFTVGGAVFVGILLAPLLVLLFNRGSGALWPFHIPPMAACAAMAIAYCFGEGLGRLACISFGCCYGKPLSACSGLIRRLFGRYCFVFRGGTKKIAYAGGMEEAEVIPIQAVTSLLYTLCGLLASGLFLSSRFSAAFLVSIITTQLWRSFSETLRADYRGEGRISAYQVMGIIAIGYAIVVALLFPAEASAPVPDLAQGLATVWSPGLILFLQGIWLTIFLYTGRSTVTGATLSFHVHHDRV